MTGRWRRAVAAACSACSLTLVIGLLVPVSLAAPPSVRAQARTVVANVGARVVTGRTFYVAPNGRDSNLGRSPARPWRTVRRVDRAALRPGDEVLFKGSATFVDNPLMPGLGYKVSGTNLAAITFGSYGRGRARLTRGVWLGTDRAHPDGPSHLTFEDLSLGPVEGFQGTGDDITLRDLQISHLDGPESRQETGIASEGSDWVIENNSIYDTGDSGMLLGFRAGSPGDPPGGDDYLISGNTVSHTGLDKRIGYARHAIYLKVADATVTGNRLTYFHDDGVSMRYRNAVVADNYIAHGGIGLAWFQYDPVGGTTQLVGNTIAYTDQAGIFVCGVKEGCLQPLESFVVQDNVLLRTSGMALNLQPTHGTYQIASNLGLGATVTVQPGSDPSATVAIPSPVSTPVGIG